MEYFEVEYTIETDEDYYKAYDGMPFLAVKIEDEYYDLITGDKIEDDSKLHTGTSQLFYSNMIHIGEKRRIYFYLKELYNEGMLPLYISAIEKIKKESASLCIDENIELQKLLGKIKCNDLINKKYYEVLYNCCYFKEVNGELIPFFAYEQNGILRDLLTDDIIVPIDANFISEKANLLYTEIKEVDQKELARKLRIIEKEHLISEYFKLVNLAKVTSEEEMEELSDEAYIYSFIKKYRRNSKEI